MNDVRSPAPRLHVLLGSGGVGKTTLAAGQALALAATGRRVGLLGIDPSRRLHDALGVQLTDRETRVPDAGALDAAILHPHQALRRWVAEACRDANELAALEQNPFFSALTDRLASATDVLAAVRVAEWAERDPDLTDLVVDTAPGASAIGFLSYPREVEAVLQGALVGWLRAFAASEAGGAKALRFGARRVLFALGRLGGMALIGKLAELFALVTAPLELMVQRLERAQAWLSSKDTELLLVTSPRDSGAAGARQLYDALKEHGLAAHAVVLNRAWPDEVTAELAAAAPGDEPPLLAHARAYARAQQQVVAAAGALAPRMIRVLAEPALAEAERRDVLLGLGRRLT